MIGPVAKYWLVDTQTDRHRHIALRRLIDAAQVCERQTHRPLGVSIAALNGVALNRTVRREPDEQFHAVRAHVVPCQFELNTLLHAADVCGEARTVADVAADVVLFALARREGTRCLPGLPRHFQLLRLGRHFLLWNFDLLLRLFFLRRRLFLFGRGRRRRGIGQHHDASQLPLRSRWPMSQIHAAPYHSADEGQHRDADDHAPQPDTMRSLRAIVDRDAVHQVPIRAVTNPMFTPRLLHKSMTVMTLAYCARASPLIATDIFASR